MLLKGMASPPDHKEPVVEPPPNDDKPDDLTSRALRLRIRQQELLAELGVLALQGTKFMDMLDQTARITAEGLSAEYCKVLEYIPAENRLLVRAGVGWDTGVVGSASVGADLASPEGMRCVPASQSFRTISKTSSASEHLSSLSSTEFAGP